MKKQDDLTREVLEERQRQWEEKQKQDKVQSSRGIERDSERNRPKREDPERNREASHNHDYIDHKKNAESAPPLKESRDRIRLVRIQLNLYRCLHSLV